MHMDFPNNINRADPGKSSDTLPALLLLTPQDV